MTRKHFICQNERPIVTNVSKYVDFWTKKFTFIASHHMTSLQDQNSYFIICLYKRLHGLSSHAVNHLKLQRELYIIFIYVSEKQT